MTATNPITPQAPFPRVLSLRERCEVQNRILLKRLDNLLPQLMQETGFDMWLIICQEDNYDPIFKTMLTMDTWTPMLQVLVFFDRGDGTVERMSISRTNMKGIFLTPFKVKWEPEIWDHLKDVIAERDPQRIAINQGEVAWCADGLSASHKEKLLEVLPEKYSSRLVSGETLCRRWAETLIEEELELYAHVVSISHAIIAECYSREVVAPGHTTPEDLKWHYRQRAAELGLPVAFNPSFVLRRSDAGIQKYGQDDKVIRPGDMVSCDVGIEYLGLITDCKHWMYVLQEGEKDAPEGLKKLFADNYKLHEIYMSEFKQGRTGNQILLASLEKARAQGLGDPRVYSHCCGHFLHQPGPLIGHPNSQTGIPGRGDVELNYNSTFTVEVSAEAPVPEWGGQIVRFPTEEQVMFTSEGTRYIHRRQGGFHLI
jgi:Xaa-Pro aminopeptidase